MKETVDAILDYLVTLPEGTEITIVQALRNLEEYFLKAGEYSDRDLFEINPAVRKRASEKELFLYGSKYDDAPMGLPFHIPFTVMRK
ncbi:MAG: hypothetical protein ACI4NM_08055 [Bullifex sp.]